MKNIIPNKCKSINVMDILLLLFILSTPLFGFSEYYNIITHRTTMIAEISTPFYIKGIKDIVFLLFGSLLLIHVSIKKRLQFNKYIIYFPIMVGGSVLISAYNNGDPIAILAGIRTFLPLIFMLYGYIFATEEKNQLIYKVLEYVFIFELILAFIEIFTSQFYGVRHIFGFDFSARLGGTFSTPAPFSLFISLYCLLNMHFNGNRILRYLGLVLLVLSGSGTGIAILFSICLFYFIRKSTKYFKAISLLFGAAMIPVVYFAIPFLSKRDASIYTISLANRLYLMSSAIFSGFPLNLLFSTNFGMNSQTYNMLSQNAAALSNALPTNIATASIGLPTDSLIAFLIGSIGIIPTLLFYYIVIKYLNKYDASFSIMFILCSITVNILELFPVNVVFMIMIGTIMRGKTLKGKMHEAK